MTDSGLPGKLPNKEERRLKGLGGSLSLRILFVTFMFLILPLLLLSAMMYWQSYTQKIQDNFFALKIVADEKKQQDTIYCQMDEALLGATEALLFFEHVEQLIFPNPRLNDLLAELATYRVSQKSTFISQLSYAQIIDGKYLCVAASDSRLIGQDMTAFLSNRSLEQGTYTYFYIEEKEAKDTKFYVSKMMFSKETGRPIGVVLMMVEGAQIAQNLSGTGQFTVPVSVSILSSEGRVIVSTLPDLLGHIFLEEGVQKPSPPEGISPYIYLYPEDNNFKFRFGGQERMGVISEGKARGLFILVEASADINLINLPYYLGRLAVCFILILIFGGGGTVWFTYRVARPLRQLCRVMQQVGEGDLGVQFTPDPMGFELNIVGEYFNAMVTSLLSQIEQVKNEKIQKEMFAKELKIGQDIQSSMLPATLSDIEGLEIASGYLAARNVGGDFYDILPRENPDESIITIADTSGKGVFACLYSLVIRSILRSYLWRAGNRLAEGIIRANAMFLRDTGETGAFVTAWVAYYHRVTKILTYTSCGHFPVYLKRVGGEIEELTTSGMALGVLPYTSVETKEVQLQTGDTLILFTDGVVEAHNKQNQLFGTARLKLLIEQDTGQLAQKLVNTILESVAHFAEGVPQHDDITVLVIRI